MLALQDLHERRERRYCSDMGHKEPDADGLGACYQARSIRGLVEQEGRHYRLRMQGSSHAHMIFLAMQTQRQRNEIVAN